MVKRSKEEDTSLDIMEDDAAEQQAQEDFRNRVRQDALPLLCALLHARPDGDIRTLVSKAKEAAALLHEDE